MNREILKKSLIRATIITLLVMGYILLTEDDNASQKETKVGMMLHSVSLCTRVG